MVLLKLKAAIKEGRPHMKVNLKTTNEAENTAEIPICHQRGQRTVNGIIGNTRRGIVVDKTLDPDSNNPVANKPVSTALASLAGKIDAALQKPTGLTKTKLVGVGAQGQENIEIGDNLTLANGKLAAAGGSVSPTLNLIDFETEEIRTSITEEEYNNLKNGLYNSVNYYTEEPYETFLQSKLFIFDGGCFFSSIKVTANSDTPISSTNIIYELKIDQKDTSGNYPITIEKVTEVPFGSNSGGGGSGDSIPILDITLDEDNPRPLTDAQVNLLQANDGKLVIININFKADGTSLQATPTLAYILTSGPIIELGGFKALICAGYFPYFNSMNNFAWSNTYIYVNNDNTFRFESNGFKIPNETEAGKVLMVSDSTYQDGAGKMIWSYEFKTISLFGKYSILVPYYNNSTDTNILPLPADASTSTYVLKAVNGVIKWAKASGGVMVTFED